MRHRRRTLIPALNGSWASRTSVRCKMPEFDRHFFDGRPDPGEHGQEKRVAIALDHLVRSRGRPQPTASQASSSRSGGTWACVPTAPESLPTAMSSRASSQSPSMAAQLVVPNCEFQSKRGRLGVDAVGPSDRRRVFVFECPPADGLGQLHQALVEQIAGLVDLYGKPGIDDIGARQAEMDKARGLADGFAHRAEKCDDIVIGLPLDLLHALEIAACRPDLVDCPFGDTAAAVPPFTGGKLNRQPCLDFPPRSKPTPFRVWCSGLSPGQVLPLKIQPSPFVRFRHKVYPKVVH